MIGILLISHYTLAESMKDTVFLIVGKKDNVEVLSLLKDDSLEDFSEKLKKAVKKMDNGDGVLILTDMFGGTPSNVSLSLFGNNDKVRIITGFNLPVVIEAVMNSSETLDELMRKLMKKREKTIIDANTIFRNKG